MGVEKDARIAHLCTEALAAWPTLGAHRPALERALEALEDLSAIAAADLLVALAASAGDPLAFAHLDALVKEEARRAAASAHVEVSEVAARLHERYFAGTGRAAAALPGFRGLGALRSWVRVGAVREAQRLRLEAAPPAESSDEPLADSAELAHLREAYGAAFRAAFATALAALSVRDRTLLRLVYVEGASVEAVAQAHRVHRVTASRWLSSAREELASAVRTGLRAQLDLGTHSAISVERFLQREIDVSLRTLFDGAEPSGEG